MSLKQTEQRALKSAVQEVIFQALAEKGFYAERVEGGIALAVTKDGEPVSKDFEVDPYFFLLDAKFKKDFDIEEEIEHYQEKLEKAKEKANGTSKAKVSAKDLDIKQMSAEEIAELEKRLEQAKGTAKKPDSLMTKEDKKKAKDKDKNAILKAIEEGAKQGEKEKAEEEKTAEPTADTVKA